MTYIPDTRNRYKHPLYKNTRGSNSEDFDNRNAYWEGYLSDEDGGSASVVGYDYAADTADNVFHNLDCYEFVLVAAGLMKEEDEFLDIDEGIVFGDKELETYTEEDLEAMSPLTRMAKAFREIVVDWMESERDSFIVGNIEGMDDEEYNKCVRKADDEGYENIVVRSYPEDAKQELQRKEK